MWHGWDGGRRAWTSDVSGREVVAVPDGFAVGALSGACAEVLGEQEAQRGAYVVDASGETRDVVWQAGAERRCGVVPDSPGCVVDVASGTGEVVPGARETPGPGFLRLGTSGPAAWAASTDGTRLAWTQDGGRTWSEHRTTLTAAPGDTVQSSAAGDVAVFFAWPRVEVSRDHGATWQERDLESALAPVLVANPVLHVTADGLLAGVSYPTTGRPFVFVSTDTSWTRFERSDFRTARGDFDLGVSGPWLWTHDQGSTWLSRDALDWRQVVLQRAAAGVGPQMRTSPRILERAAPGRDVALVVVGRRIAARGLVARRAQAVGREPVGRRDRARLLRQRAEHALLVGGVGAAFAPVTQGVGQLGVAEPPELPLLGAAPVQHRRLERLDGDHARARLVEAQGLDGDPQRLRQGERLAVGLAEVLGHLLGGSAHGGVALLVGHLTVVRQAVDLVLVDGVAHLADEELDLVGLLAAGGEDRPERLGVGVGEPASGDVTAVVGVARACRRAAPPRCGGSRTRCSDRRPRRRCGRRSH